MRLLNELTIKSVTPVRRFQTDRLQQLTIKSVTVTPVRRFQTDCLQQLTIKSV
jgi:hypothetical protein